MDAAAEKEARRAELKAQLQATRAGVETAPAKEARTANLKSQLETVRSGAVPADGDTSKAARKAALASQLQLIRSGDVPPAPPADKVALESQLRNTTSSDATRARLADKAALASQLQLIRSGDASPAPPADKVALESQLQNGTSTSSDATRARPADEAAPESQLYSGRAGDAPPAPPADKVAPESQLQNTLARAVEEPSSCAPTRLADKAVPESQLHSIRAGDVPPKGDLGKSQAFEGGDTNAASQPAAIRQNACGRLANQKDETKPAESAKADETKSFGKRSQADQSKGFSEISIEIESSRLFDYTATSLKSRLGVSVVCVAFTVILTAVFVTMVDISKLSDAEMLLLAIAFIVAAINMVLGLCWLLDCSWMAGKRFRLRKYDDDNNAYDEAEP